MMAPIHESLEEILFHHKYLKNNSVEGPSINTGTVSINTGTALGLHNAPSPVEDINSGRTTPTGTTVTNFPPKDL